MRSPNRLAMTGVALVALAAACATGDAARAPPPSPFLEVRSLALVRAVDERSHRPKDALDGLEESLRARGYEVRLVELGRERPPELAPVERLFGQLEARAAAGRQERLATPVSSIGPDAATAVMQLRVDAIATYHRLDRGYAGALPAAPGAPGTIFPQAPPAGGERPVGALVLVDQLGRVAVFGWGDSGSFDDPSVPLNAAEAIDHLLRALTGEPPPDE
jgi:hypothetical protein